MKGVRIVVDLKVVAPGRVAVTVIDPNGEAQPYGNVSSPAECVALMPQVAACIALILGTEAVELCGESG